LIAVDTSAVIAIALNEPERLVYLAAIERSERAFISSVSVIEAKMVMHARRGPRAVLLLDDLLRTPPIEVVAPSPEETTAAYAAFVLYGRGSGHSAGLNFGDLFSYALAKVRGLPLLFKGNDFSETDLRRVM
jgi:ribonuclease VapC